MQHGKARLFDMKAGRTRHPVVLGIVFIMTVATASLAMDMPQAPEATTEGANRVRIISFELKKVHIESDKSYLSIDGDYPVMVCSDKAAEKDFNDHINRMIKDFEGDPEDLKAFAEDYKDSGFGSNVSFGYIAGLESQELISIGFRVEGYTAGGAHPYHYTQFFMYSLLKRRELHLNDLFRPGSGYMEILSRYCTSELRKNPAIEKCSDDRWLKMGAGPEAKNYSHVLVGIEGLEVHFDEYQVAAYACGSFEVTVPYSVLAKVIDPNGPIRQYAKPFLIRGCSGDSER